MRRSSASPGVPPGSGADASLDAGISDQSPRRRAVVAILLATAAFLLKRAYQGPHAALFASYLGNVSISFALYFLATIAAWRIGLARSVAAAAALLVVEAFELSEGFAVMSNVYDPWDLLANAGGVGLGLGLDTIIVANARWRARRREGS